MLPVDLAEISHEESIFVASLAGIMVDAVDPFLQSVANQMPWIICTFISTIVILDVYILTILKVLIYTSKTWSGFNGCDSGR